MKQNKELMLSKEKTFNLKKTPTQQTNNKNNMRTMRTISLVYADYQHQLLLNKMPHVLTLLRDLFKTSWVLKSLSGLRFILFYEINHEVPMPLKNQCGFLISQRTVLTCMPSHCCYFQCFN